MDDKQFNLIMDCLDEFDFHRVHEVMFALDWKYSDCEDVPTVEYLRKQARKYLQDVIRGAENSEGKEFIIGTGGFRYEAKIYPDGYLWLRMAFEVESWDNAE